MIISGTPVGPTFKATAPNAVWSPSSMRKKNNLTLNCNLPSRTECSEETSHAVVTETKESHHRSVTTSSKEISKEEEDSSPVWQPFGAPYDGPQFRPVKLEVTTTTRKTTAVSQSEQPKKHETDSTEDKAAKPVTERVSSPTVAEKSDSETTTTSSTTTGTNFVKSGWSSHLPPSQSPTITLLQKAREGQLPKGAIYIDEKPSSTPLPKNAVLIDQKVTVEGDKVHTDSYYAVPTGQTSTESSTHTIKAPKYDGIGPTEYGIPVGLRTTIKDEYASDWYKTMYKSLHKHRFPNDTSHTMVHYGGYMSEPEYDRKDHYLTKYSAADYRRRPEKSMSRSPEPPRPSSTEMKKVAFESSVVKHEPEKYKVEPRSIADYEPGKSSLAEKEFQKFWSDFWDSMDDLHEHLGDLSSRPHHKPGLSRRWPNVLLSDGYESDSTLIRKTGRTLQVDPETQKSWYKEIQKGGEIPLIGLRKTVPEKPAESRSTKSHPASHVYGAEPPCFNHKHIPSSSKLIPARIFRPNPLSNATSPVKQNCNMAAKTFAPPPPKRFSSKQKNVLQSVISKRQKSYGTNYNSRTCSEENLYQPRESSSAVQIQKGENSKPFVLKGFHKFHSCNNLQQLHNESVDCIKHKTFRWPDSSCCSTTLPISNFTDCFHSSSIKICDNYHDSCFPHLLHCEGMTEKQSSPSSVLNASLNGNKTSPTTSSSGTYQNPERSVVSSDTYPCCHHLKRNSIETSDRHLKSVFDMPLYGNKTSLASPDDYEHQNHTRFVATSSAIHPSRTELYFTGTAANYSNSDLAQLDFFRRNQVQLAERSKATEQKTENLLNDSYTCDNVNKNIEIFRPQVNHEEIFNKTSLASPDDYEHKNHTRSVETSSNTYPNHSELDFAGTSTSYSNSDLAQLDFFRQNQMQWAKGSKATEQKTENLLDDSCTRDNVNKNIEAFRPQVNHEEIFLMFPEVTKCFASNIFNPERPENLMDNYNYDYNIMAKVDLDNNDKTVLKFVQSSSIYSEVPRCPLLENVDNGQHQNLLNGNSNLVNKNIGNNCKKIQSCESRNNFSENVQSLNKNVGSLKSNLSYLESSQKTSEQRNPYEIYHESRSSSFNLRSIDFNRTESGMSKISHFPNNNVLGEHEIADKCMREAERNSANVSSNYQKTMRQITVSNDNTSKTSCPQNILNKYSCLKIPNIYPEKTFPRMITMLPAVVHISKLPAACLEPKLVHSEPLYAVKQFCKVDLNPLKMYLKRFDQTLLQNVDDPGLNLKSVELRTNSIYTFNDISHNCYSINNNGYVLGNQNFNHRKENMNALTYCNNIITVTDSKSNYLRPTDNISMPFSQRSLPRVQNNYLKHSENDFEYIKNRKNVFTNKNHAVFYHNYISTMVQSIGKSRKFRYLLNFYSNLESNNSTNYADRAEFRVIKIKEYDTSWARPCTYQKWDRERDQNLRIKHSSVEDLRRQFDRNANVQKASHKITLRYSKLWYNVSVSNLIEKYDGKVNSQENCQTKINSTACTDCLVDNKISPRNHPANVSENSIQDLFQNIPVNLYSQKQINFIECRSSHLLNHPSFSNSVSSSCSDLRSGLHLTQDIRTKVQFYEDISHTNSLKRNSSLCHLPPDSLNTGKFSHSRNLSWTDLRGIENNSSSTNNKSFFSPQYIPEKAMSCLDLSFASECTKSTAEPLSNHSDRGWASSTASCISQDSCDRHDVTHIRTIKTGTVSRIKNKLEKFIMSRSKSVPQDITSVANCNSNNASTGSKFLTLTPSGSVQNLKKVFEMSNNDKSPISNNHYSCSKKEVCSKTPFLSRWSFKETSMHRSEVHYKTQPKDVQRPGEVLNTCNRNILAKSSASYRNLVEEYMRNRIKSIISRFECGSLRGFAKDIGNINKQSFNDLNVSSKCNCCTHKDSAITSRTELSLSMNNTTLSSTNLHSKFQHVPTTVLDNNQQGKTSFRSGNWMKLYIPRITNSCPKPYRKKANNVIYSPLKSRHPASPHQYQESEVNIHYRSPIRNLEKEYIEEDELRRRQEDAMRKFYEEEKRKKHLQELAEIEMRRHSDFFTPSQKSPIPLNRYDNPFETSYSIKQASTVHRGPPPQTMARTLYPFVAQTPRELSLNKGDIVYINKQIDKNWYEGEHHGLIGIFPVTYVEIIPSEKANLQPRKAAEGEAIVKYNFRALTPIELSLFKGEKVILTRKMDQNWYEGRLGMKKGIFPVSYVHVLQEPGEYSTYGSRAISPKPPASPVYSPIVNGSPPKIEGPTFNTGLRPLQDKPPLNLDKLDPKSSLTQSLHIDTYNEPIPYRALYSYKPQNDDELELKEGDTVYVMEKCDDGWYVGTSLRTGLFGTFPGNYVERI